MANDDWRRTTFVQNFGADILAELSNKWGKHRTFGIHASCIAKAPNLDKMKPVISFKGVSCAIPHAAWRCEPRDQDDITPFAFHVDREAISLNQRIFARWLQSYGCCRGIGRVEGNRECKKNWKSNTAHHLAP